MPSDIRVVIFDLADVLLEFGGPDSLARLSNGHIGPAEFSRLWSSPMADALYVGASTPEAFATDVVTAFALPLSPSAFLSEFTAWFRGPLPGALELVEQVRSSAVVACLSNTNPLDVARYRAEIDIERRFDRCFFSNEMRLRKPDRACFTYVLEQLGLSEHPGHAVLLDDSRTNVAAARAAGLEAYEVRGVAEARACLTSIGLLPAAAALARNEP